MSTPVIETTDAPSRKTTPYTMTLENPFQGKANKNGDRDWVAIDVAKDDIYAFTITTDDPADVGPSLVLLNSNGRFLESAPYSYYYYYDYENADQTGQIVYRFDEDQSVFLDVGLRDFFSRGSYEVTAEVLPAPSDPIPDDATTTRVITDEEPTASSLTHQNDEDWFSLSIKQGEIVEIELQGKEGESVENVSFRLVDANGKTIEFASRGYYYYGGGTGTLQYTAREDAELFVSVASNGFLGEYSVSLEKVQTPENDIAGSADTEASLEVGDRVQSRLNPSGDSDWFAVDLEAGRSYVFTAVENSESDNPLFGPAIYLLEADGTEVAQGDFNFNTDQTVIEYETESEETLYLAVEGSYYDYYDYYSSGSSTGSYVVFMAENPTEADDAADDATTEYSLSVGAEFRGAVGAAGDEDWIAVDLLADTHYTFGAETRSENNGLFDPSLTLYDSDGNVVSQGDDAGTSLDSLFIQAIEDAGTYYLSVQSSDAFPGDDGRYLVSLEETNARFSFLGGSEGNDYLNASLAASVSTVSGRGGSDLLIGSDARNFMNGGAGRDVMKGGGGRDRMDGDGGRDVLRGNSGTDFLDGGRGNDRLFGGTRDDRLDGGGGENILVGGQGADTFVLVKGKSEVRDFDITEDVLQLDDRLFGNRDLTAQEVMTRFGSTDGTDATLSFKSGAEMTLLGVTDLGALADVTEII